jgi:hypothetical protein
MHASILTIVVWAAVSAAALAAQDHARWLADLGDPVRGEAAEIALVRMGERAAVSLVELVATLDEGQEARLLAVLRVLSLLGPDGAAAAPALADLGRDARTIVLVVETLGGLAPLATAVQ